jgi:UDP-N-acetylglucosamine--N-acetylmuramyl-(pentapeptide) pyrophosphoryl-undecaprenol N-acetylglucosamine transferase
MKPLKCIVAAGGSGGHIMPALAIANKLREKEVSILYVGNKNSMEEELAAQHGLDFRSIDVQKLYRSLTWRHLYFPYKLMKSIKLSRDIIKEFQPDFFLGTGGFVSGPVGYAAKLEKVPIFLQEQNSYPGLTTRLLSSHAKAIYLGNVSAEKYLKNTYFTGNPISESIMKTTEKLDFAEYNLSSDSFKLLLLGGSQGSVALNNTLVPIVNDLLSAKIEIIWQAGKRNFASINAAFGKRKGVYVFSFTDKMSQIYNSVDLIFSRAGAITIAEIEWKKIPAILAPLPSAAENHQYFNALELENKNIALVLDHKHLTSYNLKECILNMKANYEQFKSNFIHEKQIHSAETIASLILKKM